MSAQRELARRQQREAAAQTKRALAQAPPSAGAVDLSSMSGGDPIKQQEAADDAMKQNGFMCSCGTRFEGDAIGVMGYNLGRFPMQTPVMTPQGPQMQVKIDDGVQFVTSRFCSKQCPDYLDAVKNGLKTEEGVARPKVRAVVKLAGIEWLDGVEVSIA